MEQTASWSSVRVVGSEARIERGMGLTKQNPIHGNLGWFSSNNTIILDGGGEWAPDKISEVIANWEIPVEPEIRNSADHGFLVIACMREFGGLHTSVDDKRVSILLNDEQLDYFGLRLIPEGHTDYFHRQRREPDLEWLVEIDPVLAGCKTIYSWPVSKVHLANSPIQSVKVVLEPEVRWDIDYVAVLLCSSEKKRKSPSERSKPVARVWTNGSPPEGTLIDEKSLNQLLQSKSAYDVFVVDEGQFMDGFVGDAYVKGQPISRHLLTEEESEKLEPEDQRRRRKAKERRGYVEPVEYRLLMHTLKNGGKAGTRLDVAEACWSHDTAFVRRLTELWNSSADEKKTREEIRREAIRISKAISTFNDILVRSGLDMKLEHRRGNYSLSRSPNYCVMEMVER